MGVDIYGWIEFKEQFDGTWFGAVKIDTSLILSDRNKAMTTFLFEGYAYYGKALASQRGIPEDASKEFLDLSKEMMGGGFSWIRWDELEKIQWSEKFDLTAEIIVKTIQAEPDFEVEMTGGWMLIFDLMSTLAKYHGAENVRFVVGFS